MNIYKRQYRTLRVNPKDSGDVVKGTWIDEEEYVMHVDVTMIGYITTYEQRYVKVGNLGGM